MSLQVDYHCCSYDWDLQNLICYDENHRDDIGLSSQSYVHPINPTINRTLPAARTAFPRSNIFGVIVQVKLGITALPAGPLSSQKP